MALKRWLLTFVLLAACVLRLLPDHAHAAAEGPLAAYLWKARPMVIFAPSPTDPEFQQQMRWIEAGAADLDARKVVVLTDTDPAARGPLRQALRPAGFELVLIDKDGLVMQRRPKPWGVLDLTGIIDRSAIWLGERDAGQVR